MTQPRTITERINLAREIRRVLGAYAYYASPAKYGWTDPRSDRVPPSDAQATLYRVEYLRRAQRALTLLAEREGVKL